MAYKSEKPSIKKLKDINSSFFTHDKVIIEFPKTYPQKINIFEVLNIQRSTNAVLRQKDNEPVYEFDKKFENKSFLDEMGNSLDDVVLCLYSFGMNINLEKTPLLAFVKIAYNIIHLNKFELNNKERKVYYDSLAFLDNLNDLEDMDTSLKIKVLLDFIKNHIRRDEVVYTKKSVMLTDLQIEEIDKIEGKGFSRKVRFIIDEFIKNQQNKEVKLKEINNNDVIYAINFLQVHSYKFNGNKYEVQVLPLDESYLEWDLSFGFSWRKMISQVLNSIKNIEKNNYQKILNDLIVYIEENSDENRDFKSIIATIMNFDLNDWGINSIEKGDNYFNNTDIVLVIEGLFELGYDLSFYVYSL